MCLGGGVLVCVDVLVRRCACAWVWLVRVRVQSLCVFRGPLSGCSTLLFLTYCCRCALAQCTYLAFALRMLCTSGLWCTGSKGRGLPRGKVSRASDAVCPVVLVMSVCLCMLCVPLEHVPGRV